MILFCLKLFLDSELNLCITRSAFRSWNNIVVGNGSDDTETLTHNAHYGGQINANSKLFSNCSIYIGKFCEQFKFPPCESVFTLSFSVPPQLVRCKQILFSCIANLTYTLTVKRAANIAAISPLIYSISWWELMMSDQLF